MVWTISGKYHTSVTSSFREKVSFVFHSTKGLQRIIETKVCFSFNKSPEDALGKMCFFADVISQKGNKLQKTCRTFNTHKQNCRRNLECFWQSSLLNKISKTLLPPNPLMVFVDLCFVLLKEHMQKKLSFASGIFMSESFEGGFRHNVNLNN